jgi:glucosyl-3-phosphoglycerate synthase
MEPGKGRNAWFCFGYVLASGRAQAVALHDCDITTYRRELPARLFYPVVNPAFDYKYCKGYYARIAEDRLSGRVTRLFMTPLLRALRKIFGALDYVEFLDSFRYPLAGEFSMRQDVLRSIRIPADWGLEVGLLSEVYRNLSPRLICQADIADHYDHKHQGVSEDRPDQGLARMSTEIAKSIYRKLATEGITLTAERFRTIKATYYRIALDMLQQHFDNATFNGLRLDRHAEERVIEMFAQNLIVAGENFLASPMERPFIANWNRVFSAIEDFADQLQEAVQADNA